MKTILLATDFSAAAHNALNYSVKLAKEIKAKLILLHAFQVSYPLADNLLIVPIAELEKESNERLQKELDTITCKENLAIETVSQNGPTAATIIAVAEEKKASLIVIGGKDDNTILRKIFGSTATPLMRETTVPLLIIPQQAQYKTPKSIALASDITAETNMSVLKPLHKLAEAFESKIYVVRVIQKGLDEVKEKLATQTALNTAFKNVHHTYQYLRDDNIPKAIKEFVDDCGINILTVIPHEHSFIERIFIKSNSKNLLETTKVPLLVLTEKAHIPIVGNKEADFAFRIN